MRFYVEIATIAAVMSFVFYKVWERLMEKHHGNKKLKEEQKKFHTIEKRNMVIYEKMMYLRIKCDASRVRICLFHNGGNFLSGDPMKKFTCTHEMTSSSVSNESEKFQNTPITIFIDKINLVKKNDVRIYSIEDLSLEESKTKYLYKATHVKKFSLLPLRKNEMIIGFLEVEWNHEPKMNSDINFESTFAMIRSQIELEMLKEN